MAIFRNTPRTIAMATVALSLSACATKDFGRMESSPRSVATMSCSELAEQQAAVDAFRARVHDKARFDRRSLAAVWIDFGYGNQQDKKKALASADAHERDIAVARRAMGCAL